MKPGSKTAPLKILVVDVGGSHVKFLALRRKFVSGPRLNALLPDEIVIGGGRAPLLEHLPPLTRRGANEDAFSGG